VLCTGSNGWHINVEPPLEREYMRRNVEWFTAWFKQGTSANKLA
jgi:hypothetical protein